MKRAYPWTTNVAGQPVTLRLMSRGDLEKSIKFANDLPEEDLLFLTIDITDRAAMEQYVYAVENNRALSVLAEVDGRFIGYGSLTYNQLHWTRHLGEIRLLIAPEMRGKGLGKILVNEVFTIAQELGLQKVIAQMAAEQRGAAQVFERLGFRAEALLADFVMDREGRTHDLIVMAYDMNGLTD